MSTHAKKGALEFVISGVNRSKLYLVALCDAKEIFSKPGKLKHIYHEGPHNYYQALLTLEDMEEVRKLGDPKGQPDDVFKALLYGIPGGGHVALADEDDEVDEEALADMLEPPPPVKDLEGLVPIAARAADDAFKIPQYMSKHQTVTSLLSRTTTTCTAQADCAHTCRADATACTVA